ncbi:MAG: GNAT family N-acetyltransferase [Planctomycetes bacterium]|nr:GNAT family N-acetyltransferase [Planctomycetota bacterium]
MIDPPDGYGVRDDVRLDDVEAVRTLVAGTGYFNDDEVRIAAELVEERLARGAPSGYEFVLLDAADGSLAGYSCWGPIDGTACSYDLFWIAVRDDLRGAGLGRWLLRATEDRIAERGGGRVYAETSGRAQYASTRAFYERCGYLREAELTDFYGPGDAKVFYVKEIADRPDA